MTTCPYKNRPGYTKWRSAMAEVAPSEVAPMLEPRFKIRPGDRVASAGSCFAQHIAGHLQKAGIEPFIAEPAPPQLDRETATHFQFGLYSARYGNVYTPRQLLQLLRRARGILLPEEGAWEADGRYVDPYRPSVQGKGFYSVRELEIDRERHLAAVLSMFKSLDVFVFTLGLTEAWRNAGDGLVFPVCPGCGWGTFSSDRYEFVNFSTEEIEADLIAFADELREINREAKIILTVSPVPLVATAEDRHVLAATTYSKSVLRVCAERARAQRAFIEYFPSYEIIVGPHSRGSYFADDLRSVRTEGVEHVMKVFRNSFLGQATAATKADASGTVVQSDTKSIAGQTSAALAHAICEEEALDRPDP